MESSIEVLVACMNQNNLSLYREMNLVTNAVFANQTDKFSYEETKVNKDKNTIKIISTNQRGVGKNRNTALLYASADILLMADEDMRYIDDYTDIVYRAFKEYPNADMIVFDLHYNNIKSESKRKIKKSKRLRLYNSLSYGTPRIAIKKKSLDKANIWFSVLYGGGARYTSGEDSLFIVEALKKGMVGYTYPCVIAEVDHGDSTWFKGFNDKYYIDRGYWIANAFPLLKYPIGIYYAYRLRNSSEKSSTVIELAISCKSSGLDSNVLTSPSWYRM